MKKLWRGAELRVLLMKASVYGWIPTPLWLAGHPVLGPRRPGHRETVAGSRGMKTLQSSASTLAPRLCITSLHSSRKKGSNQGQAPSACVSGKEYVFLTNQRFADTVKLCTLDAAFPGTPSSSRTLPRPQRKEHKATQTVSYEVDSQLSELEKAVR